MGIRLKNSITIDEGFEELQCILEGMDKEGVTLEEAFELYNRGLKLVGELNGKLTEAEQRLAVVNSVEDYGEN